MEVLKNLLMGLLAGDVGLWSLFVIVALVVWVVADTAILGRGVPKGMSGKVQDLWQFDGNDSTKTRESGIKAGPEGIGHYIGDLRIDRDHRD